MPRPLKQSAAHSRKSASSSRKSSARRTGKKAPARRAEPTTSVRKALKKKQPAARSTDGPQLPPVWTMLGRTGFWLMKTEPDVFSIDTLASMGRSAWDGVRSFQARNLIRAMQIGDLALFYHSSTNPPGVVGLARVVRDAYPDHTQFDPNSQYFDATSKPDDPRWSMVDVEFVEKFPRPVTLEALKADPELTTMLVVRRGMRLSIQPVEAGHMRHILGLAEAVSADQVGV